jgi:hypothetical protein
VRFQGGEGRRLQKAGMLGQPSPPSAH